MDTDGLSGVHNEYKTPQRNSKTPYCIDFVMPNVQVKSYTSRYRLI